jgi:hypothetical protein
MDPTSAAMAGLQVFATLDSCIKLVVFTRVRLVSLNGGPIGMEKTWSPNAKLITRRTNR